MARPLRRKPNFGRERVGRTRGRNGGTGENQRWEKGRKKEETRFRIGMSTNTLYHLLEGETGRKE